MGGKALSCDTARLFSYFLELVVLLWQLNSSFCEITVGLRFFLQGFLPTLPIIFSVDGEDDLRLRSLEGPSTYTKALFYNAAGQSARTWCNLAREGITFEKESEKFKTKHNFKKNVLYFYHFFKTIFMYCAALSRNRGLDPDEAKLFQMPSQWCPVYITKLANFILKYKTYKDHLHTPTSPPISPISKHTISFLVFHGSKGCSHRQLNGRRCGGQGRARIRRNG